MIERYSLPAMADVWSDRSRLANWLEIELLAVEAWAELGRIPAEDAIACRERGTFTVEAVQEREEVTRHDIAAFVDVVAASIGPEGRWLHFGMTSSDALSTGFALQLRTAADLLLAGLERLLWIVRRQALTYRDTAIMGRSHGVHAEPTSFGHKLAVMAFELDRERERLRRAREAVSVGAVSGVVGSYAAIDPRVEELICARLGLRAEQASTQVIQRDRHAEHDDAGRRGIVAGSFRDRDRHLARTEVREVQEPFAEGTEGLQRDAAQAEPGRLRADQRAGPGDTGSQSCCPGERRAVARAGHLTLVRRARVIFPDATGLLDFMLRDMAWVMDGLIVFPDRMLVTGSPVMEASRSVSRRCSPWWKPAGLERTRIARCSERRRRRGTEGPGSATSWNATTPCARPWVRTAWMPRSTRSGSCATSAASSTR